MHEEDPFPNGNQADENGVVAVGGRISGQLLRKAYEKGIFPWPHDGVPLLWFCPDPRFVLPPANIVINKTLQKALRRTTLNIKADTNFLGVIKECQRSNRQNQDGTWITDEMIEGYNELFLEGLAHSIEAYDNDKLVGGLYGLSLGKIFFGESMFFKQDNASKICLVSLAAHLKAWNFSLIDCQAHTLHLEKFGAYPMARKAFLTQIKANQKLENKLGTWALELSPQQALKLLA